MKNKEIINIIESSLVSVASSFPGLASIATGWNEYKNHIQTKNIESIIKTFYQKLNNIEDKVNKEYLKSDDLKALLMKTCFYGKEEMSAEKRKMLSLFLANSCTNFNFKDITKNTILETIVKLSEFDIHVVDVIAKASEDMQNPIISGKKKYNPINQSWLAVGELKLVKSIANNSENDVLLTLEYLNSIGVIENGSARGFISNSDSVIAEYLKRKSFQDKADRIDELKKEDNYGKNFKEINALEKELFAMDDDKEDDLYYDYQKYYMITSLGLRVLSFLRE